MPLPISRQIASLKHPVSKDSKKLFTFWGTEVHRN